MKIILTLLMIAISSCSDRKSSAPGVQVQNWEAVVKDHFPKNPPFALKKGEEDRFKKLWKRQICLHNARVEVAKKQAKLNNLKRSFHHKTHGCLVGKLKVNQNLPADLKVGIFKNNNLDTILRYTNIGQIPDNRPDLRGLGVKVFYPNAVLDPSESQDFLVNDTDRHFASTPEDILEFNEVTIKGPAGFAEYAGRDASDFVALIKSEKKKANQPEVASREEIGSLIKQVLNYRDPVTQKTAIGRVLKSGLSFTFTKRLINIFTHQARVPLSLLTSGFHSRAPFALGDHSIKYAVEPCVGEKNGIHPDRNGVGENHLGEDLVANAMDPNVDICLQLVAYVFVDEATTPLKDYTKPWVLANGANKHILGDFEFEVQDILEPSHSKTCQETRFDIWKSVAAHEPQGDVNKGRWYIYHASRLQAKHHLQVSCPAAG